MAEPAQKSQDTEDVEQTIGLKPKRGRGPLWIGMGALVALVAVVWFLSGAPKRNAVAWTSVTVVAGTLDIEVTAVGTVEPLTQVDVGSELSGIVREVLVDANDEVAQGDVLAILDTEVLEARVTEAQAQVTALRASRDQALVAEKQARSERERALALFDEGATTEAARDQAVSAYGQSVAAVNVAAAQLQSGRASLSVAQTNLSKATLRAPIGGVVLERNVEPGQSVVSSMSVTTLFKVARDLGRMRVLVEVDEADIARVVPGSEATFTVPAFADRTFEATVLRVARSPLPNRDVVIYEAELLVANEDEALVPGMTATAVITAERHEGVLLVDNAALRFAPDDAALPTPAEGRGRLWLRVGKKLEPLDVVLGPSDGRQTVVMGAVEAGMEPVTGREEEK